MNVLVIPEDFVKDQCILKPIIVAMLKARGKIAKVIVCQNPRLRGIDQALNWAWTDIRAEVHPKEIYFRSFAKQRGTLNEWDEGRKTLAEEAARQYHRIRQLCEEVADLESRIP